MRQGLKMSALLVTLFLAGCVSQTVHPGHIEIRNSTNQRLVFFEVHEVVDADVPMRMARFEGVPPMSSQMVARRAGAEPFSEWLEISWSASRSDSHSERMRLSKNVRRAGSREGSVFVIELGDQDGVRIFEERRNR